MSRRRDACLRDRGECGSILVSMETAHRRQGLLIDHHHPFGRNVPC